MIPNVSKALITTQSHEKTIVAAEMERLWFEQERLQHFYPYLESRPELRSPFMVALAALKIRADRLDLFLNLTNGRKTTVA